MSSTGTILRFSLSQDLRNTLATPLPGFPHNHVNAYAFWWTPDSNGNNTVLNSIPMVLNGAVQSSFEKNPADGTSTGVLDPAGTFDAWLPNPYKGAKVYFVVQSWDSSPTPNLITGANSKGLLPGHTSQIAQQSDINWNAAAAFSYRFDSVELTLNNGSGDVVNLTAVNGFGLPMALSVTTTFQSGSGPVIPTTSSAGFSATATGNEVFQQIAAINPPGTSAVTFEAGSVLQDLRSRMVESPTVAVSNVPTLSGYSAGDWEAYVSSLTGGPGPQTGLVAKDVFLSGYFNGAVDSNNVWHNGGYFSYQLVWDWTHWGFGLVPTAQSQIKGYISVSQEALQKSIYQTDPAYSRATIYASSTDFTPFMTGMYTGDNNQWGAVFTQLVTGFSGGFYGSEAKSPNPAITAPIDLGWNSTWAPTYAFGDNVTNPTPGWHWDHYAEYFYDNSNSYGTQYADNLMRNYATGAPQIPIANNVYDPATKTTTATDVDVITLTIFDDYETPTGYTQPQYYDYVDPGMTGSGPAAHPDFGPVDTTQAATFNLSLSFINGSMQLADSTPLSLDLLTGFDASGAPVWSNIAVPASSQAWPRLQGIYQYSSSTNSFVETANQGSFAQPQLTNLPLPTVGGIGWYRFHVGNDSAERIFNFYVTTSAAGGQNAPLLNPNFSGQSGAFGIDGLVSASFGQDANLQPIQYVPAVSLNFLPGSAALVDSSYLTPVTNLSNGIYTYAQPSDPLIGTLSGSTFTIETDLTSAPSSLAFGWAGADAVNNHTQENANIQAYTNKMNALDVGQIVFTATAGTAPAPVTAAADLDGAWQTAAVTFGAGTYTATMTEYLPNTGFTTPVAPTSAASAPFTIPVSTQAIEISPGSNALQFSTAGNWIQLQVLNSTIPSEATLLLYATTTAGELVSRDGLRVGGSVTLQEAVRAKIGSVADDQGGQMFFGGQSVYLPSGLELHFGILTGNGVMTALPPVTVTPQPGGSALLSVTSPQGMLQVAASSSNVLGDAAVMADSQRTSDAAWVYLTQGTTMNVQVAGSCFNVNTLEFVRIDVDATTGDWSVGGVAYGATDAFFNAVRAGVDSGFSTTQGNGNFNTTLNWTVAGSSGFYAPVLLTPAGDTFVIGRGNSDGAEHIRIFGENTFGFEDMSAAAGADFDYNDMVMKLTLS